jgi:hypothetical protein
MWVIPDFRIWVIFLQGEKNFGEQKFAHLSASNFCGRVSNNNCFEISNQFLVFWNFFGENRFFQEKFFVRHQSGSTLATFNLNLLDDIHKVLPGKTNSKGKLSTVDLLPENNIPFTSKTFCHVISLRHYFINQSKPSASTKLGNGRGSAVNRMLDGSTYPG